MQAAGPDRVLMYPVFSDQEQTTQTAWKEKSKNLQQVQAPS